jgi:predicted dinucleotide-binding enzyme
MKVGIIGVGSITLELANRSAQSGYEVLISNPRGTNTLKDIALQMGSNVKLVSVMEAATAKLIILFLNRDDLENVLHDLPNMKGKIILHTNNPIFSLDAVLHTVADQSSSAVVTSLLPDSHIVQLFNPLYNLTTSESRNKDKTKIYFSLGNHKIKNDVKTYFDMLNFSPIDLPEVKQFNIESSLQYRANLRA